MMKKFSILLMVILSVQHLMADHYFDDFESPENGLNWSVISGTGSVVPAASETRISGITSPTVGSNVFKQAEDGDATSVHLSLAGSEAQDMTVQAWVFCEGNDGPTQRGGYQGIVARASNEGALHMIRLAWDPDHQEAGNTGDGWVKLQAYNGSTWDYLGIDFSQFGSATNGYFLDGTEWQSSWHLFKIEVQGNTVSAYVDDMESPAVSGTLSIPLLNGRGGFYTHSSDDYAAYFDDFSVETVALPASDFDVLILDGTIYRDGKSEPEAIDIGISDERIVAIGELNEFTAAQVIDASGLLVVPGFIDVHAHAESGGSRAQYLRQGVTTMITGNCGSSPSIPTLGATYDSLAGTLGTNYAGMIGHNRLRSNVGLVGSTPTQNQMDQMKGHIASAMEAGAFGFSTGLIYNSGFNSTTEEIIELTHVVVEHDGIYSSHIRSEGADVLEAVSEALEVGRATGARVEISHVKCIGPDVWNLSDEYLELVNDALAEGVDVKMDQYPYPASQTSINAVIPDWAENSWNSSVANMRPELEQGIRDLLAGRGGADKVYMITGPYSGRYLHEVAETNGKTPEDVIIDDVEVNGCSCIYFTMLESDVQFFMKHPEVMVGSDGPTSQHPRGQGSFPRVWGHYGRDLGFFSHQECVNKTSTLAANHFKLVQQHRGRIDLGFFADITILDPEEINDRATFDSPSLAPSGIPYVFVNGELAINNGNYTGRLSGKVLRSYDSIETAPAVWSVN